MAVSSKTLAMCDTCGFTYPHRVMRMNSYGLLVCPEDFEGQYDLKNSPLNKVPNVKDNPRVRNPRPDTGGRGITWDEYAAWITIDPQSLAQIIGNTNWQLANRTWDGI
jgi:hypothetical protein|tara:strand:- start:197 stop:520 length:324 start_codon:yes stop_codon:yes gene_type:complete